MSPKLKICKENDCSNSPTTAGYCRLHYLKNWRSLKVEKKKKEAKSLDRYIDNVLRNSPDEAGSGRNELGFERSGDEVYYGDSVREVILSLGYREDLDMMIDSIKIDEDF